MLPTLLTQVLFAQNREGDLAVMEMSFSGQGLIKTQIESLSDLIRAKAVDLTKYRVMTKENNLAILKDKKVDMARCADSECMIKFGRILKVDKLVTSNLLLSEGVYYLTLKFYDVDMGSIDKVVDQECKTCDFSKLRKIVGEATQELLMPQRVSPAPPSPYVEPPTAPAMVAPALPIKIDPEKSKAHVIKGKALYQEGDKKRAAFEFGLAVSLHPQSPEAQLYLGIALYETRQIDEAIKALLAATELNPQNPEAFRILGVLYHELGDQKNSSIFFQKYESLLEKMKMEIDN